MSEAETETSETPEPAAEPEPEPDESDAEEAGEGAEPEPTEPDEPTEPTEPQALSEKQLEKAYKRIEGEETRHRNRISEIMGEDAQALVPCPLCSGFVSGLIFPQPPMPEVVEATRAAIGLPDLSNYQQAKNAHECEDCAGLGVVLSGSKVAENAAINCATCNGSGYIVLHPQTREPVAPAVGNGQGTSELFPGVNPDDPAVQELRARGFTVIPAPQLPQPVGG